MRSGGEHDVSLRDNGLPGELIGQAHPTGRRAEARHSASRHWLRALGGP